MNDFIAKTLRGPANSFAPASVNTIEKVRQPTSEEAKSEMLKNLFLSVKKSGVEPTHVIDVGANCGDWTRECRKYFPTSRYTLIEPNPAMRAHVEDLITANSNIEFHNIGASDKTESLLFTIVERDDSCNFLLTAEQAAKHGYKQITVPVFAIDDFIEENCLPPAQILKIDAEGLDLKVLRGATKTIDHCDLVLTEAAVMCKWHSKFENTVYELVRFMHDKGFTLFDITDLNRTISSRNLWLIELAFVKKDGKIDNSVISFTQ